jgi:hypothetical protein
MVGREALLFGAFRIVVDDETQWVQHSDATKRVRIQVLAHRIFEHAYVDPRIRLRYARAFGSDAESFRRVTRRRAPTIVGIRGSFPSVDELLIDELNQLALRQHDVT